MISSYMTLYSIVRFFTVCGPGPVFRDKATQPLLCLVTFLYSKEPKKLRLGYTPANNWPSKGLCGAGCWCAPAAEGSGPESRPYKNTCFKIQVWFVEILVRLGKHGWMIGGMKLDGLKDWSSGLTHTRRSKKSADIFDELFRKQWHKITCGSTPWKNYRDFVGLLGQLVVQDCRPLALTQVHQNITHHVHGYNTQ